ncbi:MAG TPA: DUF6760 family protein [Blastocatellia bacterium]|nr:DUF6760 family protein [Blastocatellia bacterium]
MPALRAAIRRGDQQPGGVWRYPIERLYEEVAYVAYHFHWPHEQILGLEHRERQTWVREIARINQRLNERDA